MSNIVFVTGTDTGVGKTLLTAHLLHHLRHRGIHALAMKPFCSGGTADVRLLQSLQKGELSDKEVNPFHFSRPVAPLVAARKVGQVVHLADAINCIQRLAARCETLIVEGSGGILVPLGEGFSLIDVIAKFECSSIVVGRNQLGTINHSLLTCRSLGNGGPKRLCAVLMGQASDDESCRDNAVIIEEMLAHTPVFSLQYMGKRASSLASVLRSQKKIKKTLAVISDFAIFTARSSDRLLRKQRDEETEKRKKDR